MLTLGVILLLVAIVTIVAVAAGASEEPVVVELGWVSVDVEPLVLFLVGGATVLLLVVGVELIRGGVARANRRRKERKELIRRAEELEAREAQAGTGSGTASAGRPDEERTTAVQTEQHTGATTEVRKEDPAVHDKPSHRAEDSVTERDRPSS